MASGENTLLLPGKRDKFDEQLPRNKTSVFRLFRPPSNALDATRRSACTPPACIRQAVSLVRR